MDKITISVVHEDILTEGADVIVNTIDPEVSFNEGLARQLMVKAGLTLQNGIESIKKNQFHGR